MENSEILISDEMGLWWSKWLQQSSHITKGQGCGVTQRALRMGSEKMKSSFVGPLKSIFPKLKGNVGENETQSALVTNFQIYGRFCWTFCYWVIDDSLRDASKSFENTEGWHVWDVAGQRERKWRHKRTLMIKMKQEPCAGLCNSIWKSTLPFLKAWVRNGKLVQTPADEDLGWLAVLVARKRGVLGE